MIAVLGLLLFVAFNDRTAASYAISKPEQEADVAMELRVEGSREPPALSNYFPALLGYDKPPPRHLWSTALPVEVVLHRAARVAVITACVRRQMD